MKFADSHNDLLQRALAGDLIHQRLHDGHSDFVRVKLAGVVLQVLSVWVPVRYASQNQSYSQAIRQINAFDQAILASGGEVVKVGTITDVKSAEKTGKLALMMGMEGGHPIENSLEKLEEFYTRGVRYMSPTWNNSNDWASSARDEESPAFSGNKGLTAFGRKVIWRMNDLGMMPDVSHVGEQTFWDMITASQKPVIASHSSVYHLCPHPRNLKDDQLRAIAKSGGLVCINFFSGFIDPGYFPARNKILLEKKSEKDKFTEDHFTNYEAWFTAEDRLAGSWVNEVRPEFELLIDHIVYAVNLIGEDHVGLGSDFDGIESAPKGLDSVLDLKKIPEALQQRGFSEKTIEKICYKNFLRVLKDSERR